MINPRVLVLSSQPFNYLTGFGITASNLFKGWPVGRIACAYMQDIDPARDVCDKHYRVWKAGKASVGSKDHALGSIKRKFISMGFGNLVSFPVSREFKSWLIDFSPDILFCVPDSLPQIIFALKTAKISGAKVAVYMLDDWPERFKSANPVKRTFLSIVFNHYFMRLLRMSDLRLAIGSEMCNAYRRRYGLEFMPFQNCPDHELWTKFSGTEKVKGDPFRFVFTGAIYNPGNLQTLLRFSKALEIINNNGFNARLEIYVCADRIFGYKEIFSAYEHTVLFELVTEQDKIAMLYSGCDGLLLVLGFGKIDSLGEKYSMPTKLPAYMLSGTAILGIVPEDCALSRFILNNATGVLISKTDSIPELAQAIVEFCRGDALRKRVSLQAGLIAKERFSAEKVRIKFAKTITSVLERAYS